MKTAGPGRPVVHVALYDALDRLSLGEVLKWPVTGKLNAERTRQLICQWSARRNFDKLFRSKTIGNELIVRRAV